MSRHATKEIARRTLLSGFPALIGCGASRPRLNVFNWSDYVAPGTIANFEKESGVRVRYAVYESNEEMLAKVFGGNSGWDVVFPSNYYLKPMIENGLLAALDHSHLPNVRNLEPALRDPAWDRGLAHSVPYMTGATGIIYSKKATPPPRRWADLWDRRFQGRLTMLDDPAEVIGAALKKLGLPLNSVEPDRLDAARRQMLEQKPIVRAYLNAESRDQMVSGDLLAAQLWATTSQQAIAESADLAFCYPEEGFALYCDNAVILRESSRSELAHRFIDYLLRPDVAAAIVSHSQTATPNLAARALLPKEVQESRTLYPPPEIMARGEWFATLPGAAQRLRDRIWTEVKSA
jgi:spermidine/putrescine transport system substrate-binding protein